MWQVLVATFSSWRIKFYETIPDMLRRGFDGVISELKRKLQVMNAMKGDKKAAALNAKEVEPLNELQVKAHLKAIEQSDANLQHVIKLAEKAILQIMDEELNVDARLHQLEELQEFLREM